MHDATAHGTRGFLTTEKTTGATARFPLVRAHSTCVSSASVLWVLCDDDFGGSRFDFTFRCQSSELDLEGVSSVVLLYMKKEVFAFYHAEERTRAVESIGVQKSVLVSELII